jgi:hypothetical protein
LRDIDIAERCRGIRFEFQYTGQDRRQSLRPLESSSCYDH